MGGAHHGAVRRLRRPLQLLVCVLQSGLGPGDVVLRPSFGKVGMPQPGEAVCSGIGACPGRDE